MIEQMPIHSSHENAEKLKSEIFETLVLNSLRSSLFNTFKDNGFDQSFLNDFAEQFTALSEQEKHWALSMPWELKQRAIPTFKNKIQDGSFNASDVLTMLIESGKRQLRDVAYHASNTDIPKTDLSGRPTAKPQTWFVRGTERDHRNNDNLMAYYSEDYEHLYRTKNPRFLYIVSFSKKTGSGHYPDGSQKWGRAPRLDIIEKVDLREIDRAINLQFTNQKKEREPNTSD